MLGSRRWRMPGNHNGFEIVEHRKFQMKRISGDRVLANQQQRQPCLWCTKVQLHKWQRASWYTVCKWCAVWLGASVSPWECLLHCQKNRDLPYIEQQRWSIVEEVVEWTLAVRRTPCCNNRSMIGWVPKPVFGVDFDREFYAIVEDVWDGKTNRDRLADVNPHVEFTIKKNTQISDTVHRFHINTTHLYSRFVWWKLLKEMPWSKPN